MHMVVSTLERDGSVLFPGADDRSIRFVASMLTAHRFAPIPLQYATFLKETDGLLWNGVEFFGTRAVERDHLGYIFPGLIEANMELLNYDVMRGSLLLGRASEEIFVYSSHDREYLILDRTDFTANARCSTFQEIFYIFMEELF